MFCLLWTDPTSTEHFHPQFKFAWNFQQGSVPRLNEGSQVRARLLPLPQGVECPHSSPDIPMSMDRLRRKIVKMKSISSSTMWCVMELHYCLSVLYYCLKAASVGGFAKMSAGLEDAFWFREAINYRVSWKWYCARGSFMSWGTARGAAQFLWESFDLYWLF